MGIELALFLIIGGIAILSAVMMLISDNAVHSALFLILNFGCVAFFYLMLNAPFLAMVQITVYAGAIMVLFTFVIMLLGAEKLTPEAEPQFPWLVPAALTVTSLLLLLASIAILQSDVDAAEPYVAEPQLRVIHAAGNVEQVNLYLQPLDPSDLERSDGNEAEISSANLREAATTEPEIIAQDVVFGEYTEYETYPIGEYELWVLPENAEPLQRNALYITSVFLNGDDVISLLLLADVNDPTQIRSVTLPSSLETVEERNTVRFTVVNALPCPSNTPTCPQTVEIADITDDYTDDPFIVLENLGYGQISETQILDKGDYDFGVYPSGFINNLRETSEEDAELKFPHYARIQEQTLEANSSFLWILTSDVGNQINPPVSIIIHDQNHPSFGGPEAIGFSLFTAYLFPFEVIGVLLLTAMIGVIVMTKEAQTKTRRSKARRMANVPGNPTIQEYVKSLQHDTSNTDQEAH